MVHPNLILTANISQHINSQNNTRVQGGRVEILKGVWCNYKHTRYPSELDCVCLTMDGKLRHHTGRRR